MKIAPEITASNFVPSPSMPKRAMAPLAMSSVTMKPASHWAGICRLNGDAAEKTICWTLLWISRLPIADQINIGHTQVSGTMILRVVSLSLTRPAIMKPAAIAYHHQRCPLSISFNSASKTWKKLNRMSDEGR
jgi:hypothetical protein